MLRIRMIGTTIRTKTAVAIETSVLIDCISGEGRSSLMNFWSLANDWFLSWRGDLWKQLENCKTERNEFKTELDALKKENEELKEQLRIARQTFYFRGVLWVVVEGVFMDTQPLCPKCITTLSIKSPHQGLVCHLCNYTTFFKATDLADTFFEAGRTYNEIHKEK